MEKKNEPKKIPRRAKKESEQNSSHLLVCEQLSDNMFTMLVL